EQAMRRPLQMGYFVMLLVERGTAASERGDHYGALKYYRALAKAVPERSQAFKMLCKEYEVIGDFEHALENCKLVLGKSGVTVDDNARFVDLTLRKRGALPQSDIEDVEAVIAHLETQLGNSEEAPIITNQLCCDLATRLEDVARLEECTKQLRTLAPKDPKTLAYSWALALKKRDFHEAKRIIHQAKRIGLPAPAIEKMERGLASEREHDHAASTWLRPWGFVGGSVMLFAAVLSAFLLRRKRTLIAGQLGQG
ncbi:MAG TPA: hypothetical protein VG963_04570, partial [Polyangiaceae bacterium]|nr:hypothetical protein [Polyangiaceae bacterium]